MKVFQSVLTVILTIAIIQSFSQSPSYREIAINEAQLSYLEEETSDFAQQFNFDTRFNTFKEVYRKTYLFLTPDLDMKDLIKPVPRTAVVKAYKLLKKHNVWAVKYENYWGFMADDDLIPIEEYEEPLSNDDLDIPPQLLSKFTVRYPSTARRDSISGEVVLRILVSNTGEVSRVEVEKSIPVLDSAAIRAALKLRFKPAKKYGSPTDVWVRVPMNFELK